MAFLQEEEINSICEASHLLSSADEVTAILLTFSYMAPGMYAPAWEGHIVPGR